MRILVADDTGLIKNVQVEDQKLVSTFGRQEKGLGVKHIVRVDTDYFVASHEDFHVRIYSLNDPSYSYEAPLSSQSPIVSLNYNENKVYVLQKDGTLSQVDILYQEDMPYLEEPQTIIKINATQANRARLNPFNTSQIVILSQGTNPQIVDLETKTQIWKAKNVKNDHLDLTVPIHDLDCAFKSEKEFYVCTAYHKIRLYDTKVKTCKPVIDYEFPHTKHPFNNILLSHCKNYIYVSDYGGNIFNLDLRKDFKIIGKLKGALGAVQEMVMSENTPYLASVSLDRYLRVYNINSNTLFQKLYMKQKLSSVFLIDEEVEEKKDASDEEEEKVSNPILKKAKPQNEVKKNAKQLRAQAKNARMRLTFEVKKKVKTENYDEQEQEQEMEDYNEDYDQNDEEADEAEEY